MTHTLSPGVELPTGMDRALLLSFEELEDVHWWFVVRRRLVLAAAERWAPEPMARVAEVGCGTGGMLRALARGWPQAEVLGIEPDSQAAAVACSRGCAAVSGRFECLPLASGSVDMLLALDVIEHVPDDRTAFAEAWRVLRPGGRLIATVPALPWLWGPHDEVNGHYRRYRRGELEGRARAAAFQVERVTFFNSLLLPLGVLERAALRRLGERASLGLTLPPRPINSALRRIFGLERRLLDRVNLPIGMSLLLIATRPESEVSA